MADHDVTLTYATNGDFTAVPNSIGVLPGQTIAFQLGPESQSGKIRITFRDPQFFAAQNPYFASSGVLNDGDGLVTVVAAPSGRTTYHCELLDELGNVRAQSKENAGGDVFPVSS